MAENHAATRNSANVAANGNKMRSADNGKVVRCRTVIWIVYDHAINNVIAAKNAADNAAEKRRRDAVRILIRISNSRLRIHIVDVELAHHAAIAIGNEAAKLTLVIFNLNCHRLRGLRVANNNAAERISLVAKSAKRGRIDGNLIALSRLNAVIRTLHIAVHGFVAQRLRGIGRIVYFFLPLTLAWVVLLIDVHDLVVGPRAVGLRFVTPLAQPGLIGGNSDFPAIQRHAVVDIVGDGVHFRRVLNGIRIAICAASLYQLWNALVDFNFVILDAILGGFSLVNIRKVVTEPRPDVTVLLTINRHIAAHGTIRRFVVIPKLLARVLLVLGIDFASVRHHSGIGLGLSKGVIRRARARTFVAKTLQQARMGENRIAILAGQADSLKLCRHLIGLTAYTKLSEQRRSRLGATRVPSSLDILRVQAHVLLHLVDEQRHIGVSVRGAVGAVDNQIVERKIIN